jgi:uncharacterized lipoprotein
MDEDEAWEKITNITNKANMTVKDVKEVRALMVHMPKDQQAWIEEGLFLEEQAKKRG